MGPEVRLPWASIPRQLEAGARAGRAMGAPRTWERRLCRPQWTPPDPPSRRACDGAGQPRGPAPSLQGVGRVLGGQLRGPGDAQGLWRGLCVELPAPALWGGGLVCLRGRVLHSCSGVPRPALWSQEGAGQGAPSRAHRASGVSCPGSLWSACVQSPWGRAPSPGCAVGKSHISRPLFSRPQGGRWWCAPRGCTCLGPGRGLATTVTLGPNARPGLGARGGGTGTGQVGIVPASPFGSRISVQRWFWGQQVSRVGGDCGGVASCAGLRAPGGHADWAWGLSCVFPWCTVLWGWPAPLCPHPC